MLARKRKAAGDSRIPRPGGKIGASWRGDYDIHIQPAQRSDNFRGGSVIGHDCVDGVQIAEFGDRLAAKLGMVETKNDLPGGLDHRALDIDQQTVGVGYTFDGNSAGAHDGNIRVNFGKGFDGKRSNKDSEPRINHTSRNDDFDAVGGREQVCDGKRVGDDLGGLALKVAGDVVHRGSGVEDDALVGQN